MNYYEVKFTYQTELDTALVNDILAAELGEIGFESFTSDGDSLIAYVPESAYDEATLEQKLATFPLGEINFHHEAQYVESKDWNEEWEKNYFKPIHIGKDCVVRASFHEAEPGYTYNILIDPKMAFGTGNHATTYQMITFMLELDLTGKKLLDMGCGTAVLAILAKMKGAGQVVAIDIDEWAYNNALENIRINQTPDIEIALGGAERIAEYGTFDVIFANINRNILLADMGRYATAMRPGAELFMSGFYPEDIPALTKEGARHGLKYITKKEKNGWAAIKMAKE